MANDISAIQNLLAPKHNRVEYAGDASALIVSKRPEQPPGDRVTLTDAARKLQAAELKLSHADQTKREGRLHDKAPPIDIHHVQSGNSASPAMSSSPLEEGAQRPTPAMANMLAAFFTTSDMEGFDANSDLNADGMINFQDLAALRDIEAGVATQPAEAPDTLAQAIAESFLSSEGEKSFDATADLNGDGITNFLDLAVLRASMEDS